MKDMDLKTAHQITGTEYKPPKKKLNLSGLNLNSEIEKISGTGTAAGDSKADSQPPVIPMIGKHKSHAVERRSNMSLAEAKKPMKLHGTMKVRGHRRNFVDPE